MYRCLQCGLIFDEPVRFWEARWHDLDEPLDEFMGCPECRGMYEEVFHAGDCVRDGC